MSLVELVDQRVASTKPHDYGELWDTSDIRELKFRYMAGESIQEIADHMGRSYGGVKSRLYRLRKNDPTAVRSG